MLRSVAVLVLDELSVFEYGVLGEVFGVDRSADGLAPIEFRVCGVRVGDPVRTTGGVHVVPEWGLDGLEDADIVAVTATDLREYPPEALEALRGAAAGGATVLTICSGVFVAGAAGLLDGRRCTSHWKHVDELRALYPTALVDPDVLFVDDGDLVSSAGTAAGIDACLHLVRRELGSAAVNILARQMVVSPQRDGGQRQFIEQPVPACTNLALAPTLDWARERLDHDLSVTDLATHARMSERSFGRRFLVETGTTPHRWLVGQRVQLAQRVLEDTDLGIDDVAAHCGFGAAALLRHHFRKHVGITPGDYRRKFQTVPS